MPLVLHTNSYVVSDDQRTGHPGYHLTPHVMNASPHSQSPALGEPDVLPQSQDRQGYQLSENPF